MAIHHHNNTPLKGTDLLHLKGTGLLLHKVTDHHHLRDILRQMDIRTLYLSLLPQALANLEADHKVIQAIHLLREDPHHSQGMEGMARHHRSSHQDPMVEDISRYMVSLYKQSMHWAESGIRHHHQRARVMGRLYREDHSTEGDQVSTSFRLYF